MKYLLFLFLAGCLAQPLREQPHDLDQTRTHQDQSDVVEYPTHPTSDQCSVYYQTVTMPDGQKFLVAVEEECSAYVERGDPSPDEINPLSQPAEKIYPEQN